jgi:hypothetical protein
MRERGVRGPHQCRRLFQPRPGQILASLVGPILYVELASAPIFYPEDPTQPKLLIALLVPIVFGVLFGPVVGLVTGLGGLLLAVGDYGSWIWWPWVVVYGGAGGLAGVACLLPRGWGAQWRPALGSVLVANLVTALTLGLACLLTWQESPYLRIWPASVPLTLLWFNLVLIAARLITSIGRWLRRVTRGTRAAAAVSTLAALVLPDDD